MVKDSSDRVNEWRPRVFALRDEILFPLSDPSGDDWAPAQRVFNSDSRPTDGARLMGSLTGR
jgi:hypothetical protein